MLALAGWCQADPVVPWAQPQTFPEQADVDRDIPIFERAMREERRRKEQGITGTVDVESLKTTPVTRPPVKVESQPAEEAFTPLERGAEGPRVEAVQKALLSLGFGLPAGADGDYGGQTVSAVTAFQSSTGLPLTGKLDKQTYETLLKIKPQDGKQIWEDPSSTAQSVPERPTVSGKMARVLIDLSEHRLFVYDSAGSVQRVFPVASGAEDTPTDPGVKVVNAKLEDPTELAEKLWPDSKGLAFGKRLIDLNWFDVETGSQTVSDEELHGTYVLQSIGSYASHGCVRLTNQSIEWLYQNLAIGDILVIRE